MWHFDIIIVKYQHFSVKCNHDVDRNIQRIYQTCIKQLILMSKISFNFTFFLCIHQLTFCRREASPRQTWRFWHSPLIWKVTPQSPEHSSLQTELSILAASWTTDSGERNCSSVMQSLFEGRCRGAEVSVSGPVDCRSRWSFHHCLETPPRSYHWRWRFSETMMLTRCCRGPGMGGQERTEEAGLYQGWTVEVGLQWYGAVTDSNISHALMTIWNKTKLVKQIISPDSDTQQRLKIIFSIRVNNRIIRILVPTLHTFVTWYF